MCELIVLGQIPGTKTQISFGTWLLLAGVLAVFIVLYQLRRRHVLRNSLVTLWLMRLVRRPFATAPTE